MNKVLPVAVIVILILLTINVIAQETNPPPPEEGIPGPSEPSSPEEAKSVTPEPAPSEIIAKADKYIISIVGQSYFDQYFEPLSSASMAAPDKDGSSYSVTYLYTAPEKVYRAHGADVRLNINGDVVSYKGPDKPYQFLITREQVLNIAKNNGMTNPTDAAITYGGNGLQTDKGPIYESYVWVVSSDTAQQGTPYAMAIDVDSGMVLGRLTQGSTRITPQAGSYGLPTYNPNILFLYVGIILFFVGLVLMISKRKSKQLIVIGIIILLIGTGLATFNFILTAGGDNVVFPPIETRPEVQCKLIVENSCASTGQLPASWNEANINVEGALKSCAEILPNCECLERSISAGCNT